MFHRHGAWWMCKKLFRFFSTLLFRCSESSSELIVLDRCYKQWPCLVDFFFLSPQSSHSHTHRLTQIKREINYYISSFFISDASTTCSNDKERIKREMKFPIQKFCFIENDFAKWILFLRLIFLWFIDSHRGFWELDIRNINHFSQLEILSFQMLIVWLFDSSEIRNHFDYKIILMLAFVEDKMFDGIHIKFDESLKCQ